MKNWYQFGHTIIEIERPDDMLIPENMSRFEIECVESADRKSTGTALGNDVAEVEIAKKYHLEFTDDLASYEKEFGENHPDAKEIMRRNMMIYQAAGKEFRSIFIEGTNAPYAVLLEESPKYTKSFINRAVARMLQIDTFFVAALGIEKVMIRESSLILHSAYMCRNGEAVLFSAPSGTGKSTQADLWTKYRGTRTINGDKSLLIRDENGWNAYGWPICGTSEICNNESYPVRAIVMLYQAKENKIRRLGIAEAMKKVFSQITINMWNAEYQMKAMDLIQELVTEVPVYELGCDISEDAVKCLEEVLINE